jgi:hypothetical protein
MDKMRHIETKLLKAHASIQIVYCIPNIVLNIINKIKDIFVMHLRQKCQRREVSWNIPFYILRDMKNMQILLVKHYCPIIIFS